MLYKIYLLTGVILLLLSIYQFKRSMEFIGRGQRTTGVVSSFHEIDGAWSPVFTVKTKEGPPIEYHHASASNPASWKLGEEANFLYDPAERSAKMVRYFWLFNWALLFVGIAVPLLIFGVGYYLLRPLLRVRPAAYSFKPSNHNR